MILLHHCCAVCTPKVLELLRAEFKQVTGYWYNPNIMPEEEQRNRLAALESYAETRNHKVIREVDNINSGLNETDWWMEEAKKIKESGKSRCEFCYYVRMKRAAKTALAHGMDGFTTTLLSSPYQKHEKVKEAGERAGCEENIKFIYKDFRPFFYEGRNEIYKMKLYMQKFCGCPASRDCNPVIYMSGCVFSKDK